MYNTNIVDYLIKIIPQDVSLDKISDRPEFACRSRSGQEKCDPWNSEHGKVHRYEVILAKIELNYKSTISGLLW